MSGQHYHSSFKPIIMQRNLSNNSLYTLFNLRLIKYAFLLALACVPKPGKAQQTDKDKTIFFAVTGKNLKDTSWIYGTYHLINNGYLLNQPNVLRAFNKAKGTVVEIVQDSSKIAGAMAMGMLKDKTLTSLLPASFIDTLDKELKATIGVSTAQMNQAKPVNVTLTLSMVDLMRNNQAMLSKYAGKPLDAWFAEETKMNNKPIVPLETVEGQMDLIFNKTSDEKQAEQLKLFVRNKTEMSQISDQLINLWIAQDLPAMSKLYDNMLAISGEEDYLLKSRNEEWLKKLPKMVEEKSTFVAVGALHFAGPAGLVAQLRNLGYTVTPLKTAL